MGGGASKVAAAAEVSSTRLSLTEFKNAASEKLISTWWLEADRMSTLFKVFDQDKNGLLDATECSRAIRELAKIADHFFGISLDVETTVQLEAFSTAAQEQDLSKAVPLDVRAIELQSMINALAQLESRGALVQTQLDSLNSKIRTGTQSARGLEQLKTKSMPLVQALEAAKAALPRLEQRVFAQHNAISSLLGPKLLENVDKHEAAYQAHALAEAAALAKAAEAVRHLVSQRANDPRVLDKERVLRQHVPAAAAAHQPGSLEASLPPPPDARPGLPLSHSMGQDAAAPSSSTELATLLLLLSTAMKGAVPLRKLCEDAYIKPAELAAAAKGGEAPLEEKSKKVAPKKVKKGGPVELAAATDGASLREAISGPFVKPIGRCCEAAHEEYEGDYTRLLDLLTASIAFEKCAALLDALEWLLGDAAKASGFEALHAIDELTRVWDPYQSAGKRRVVVYGWLSFEGAHLLVEVQLHLRSMLRIKDAVPDAPRVLRTLRAADEYFGASYEPLSTRVFDRVKAGLVRKIEANRVPIAADQSWETGAMESDLSAILSSGKNTLVELSLSREVMQSTGRHLEKLLGVGYSGQGQMLHCTRLRVIQLGRNGLKGNLPEAIALCKGLTRLELHENQLEGKMPAAIAEQCVELEVFRLSGNQIAGELPDKWGSTHLTLVDVSKNLFTGALPKALVGLPELETLDISHCRFNGHLPGGGPHDGEAGPGEVWKCSKLRVLRVNHNRIQGNLPRVLFETCPLLVEALFGNNTFGGELPATVRNCTQLVELDFHTNFLSGSIPAHQLKQCKSLRTLNFSNQKGEEPLVIMVDDGSKVALLAALDGCTIFWPDDTSDNPERAAERDKMLTDAKMLKERTEKQRLHAFEEWKMTQDTTKKQEATLAQLEEHLAKVKKGLEDARVAQQAAFDSFCTTREKEADAKVALAKLEDNLK